MSKKLSKFEGKDVTSSTIRITNAGDGLSEAMKVDAQEFHQGERRYVVLECDVADVTFKPVDKDDPSGPQRRVHTFKAGTATIVEADLVQSLIEQQRERNLRAQEEAAGIVRLPIPEDTDVQARVRTHAKSMSKAELVDFCEKWSVEHDPKATKLDLIEALVADADKIEKAISDGD